MDNLIDNEESSKQSGSSEKADKGPSGNLEAAEAIAAAADRANPDAQEKFLEPKIENASLSRVSLCRAFPNA
ncbi:MAG: hypothetical protein JSS76_00140 [Bacteroidetes bacterium]|nr:hypothetical protein [Bacteroidota bacterium]